MFPHEFAFGKHEILIIKTDISKLLSDKKKNFQDKDQKKTKFSISQRLENYYKKTKTQIINLKIL